MDLALISVPLVALKKKHDRIHSISAQFNFGALSLASSLGSNGFSVKVFDPQHYAVEDQLPAVLSWVDKNNPAVIGLSCISGFSYPNLRLYCSEIKRIFPNIPIIAGGKDHLGHIADLALVECPELDLITTGECEHILQEVLNTLLANKDLDLSRIANVITRSKDGNILKSKEFHHGNVEEFVKYDYCLYEDYHLFPASVEVARGCPFKCEFCVNDQSRPYQEKKVLQIVAEAEYLQRIYDDSNVFIYFQTPFFNMTENDLAVLASERRRRGLKFNWRTQGRVDVLTEEKMKLMAEAGAKVVDLGLESGSPDILLRMGKTKTPKSYLEKAAHLFHAAKSNGLIVKVNIMFYIGESWETLRETYDFIRSNEDSIAAISAYPVLVYPGGGFLEGITDDLKRFGGSLETSAVWKERHLTPIHPSREFTYDDMHKLGSMFGKSFQTYRSFFEERKYCYYRPKVTYDDFCAEIKDDQKDLLPCSENKSEMLANRKKLEILLNSKNKDLM